MRLLEKGGKVPGMLAADLLDTKIINYQAELDKTPLVAPQAGSGGSLVISLLLETDGELVVGQFLLTAVGT